MCVILRVLARPLWSLPSRFGKSGCSPSLLAPQPLSGLPRRLVQPPGPHSLLTSAFCPPTLLATSQGHPSLCHRGPVPRLPAPHRGSAQPASPASPFSVPVPGEQSSRFLRPLFPIACSRMPDAGLARTRTALLLPRWGFHVTCWEASLSSPFRHSADLFSVLRY